MLRFDNIFQRLTALEGLPSIPSIVSSLTIQKTSEVVVEPQPQIAPPPVEPEECCICMDNQLGGNGTVKLNCGHEICLGCFMNIMNSRGMGTRNRCPLCREPFQQPPPPPVINGRVLQRDNTGLEDMLGFIDSDSESDNESEDYIPPIGRPRPQHTLSLAQRRIMLVIGNHPRPANVINDRITRNRVRTNPYGIQTIRNNCNILVRVGVLRRVGRNYQRV